MGVKGLMQLIKEKAPSAVVERINNDYVNKRIAVDASILLYQFITTMTDQAGNQFKNDKGEPTGHLVGLLAKVARYFEAGIKPVFVFDGKAGDIKEEELERRKALKIENQQKAEEALEHGDQELYAKYEKRAVRMGPLQYEQTIKLLDFLGIPYIRAPREAESLCVALNRANIVYAVASHDMDCLAYGTPRMIRHLSEYSKNPIEIRYDKILQELQLTENQFIDLCLLLGCDYINNIKGVGPKKALELIQQYQTIERIVENIKDERNSKGELKYPLEENYLDKVAKARNAFQQECKLTLEQDTEYSKVCRTTKPIDKEGAIKFLVEEMQFDQKVTEDRINRIIKKKNQKKQTTITSFLH